MIPATYNEFAIKICTAVGVSTDGVSRIEILPLVPGHAVEIRIDRVITDDEAAKITEVLQAYKWVTGLRITEKLDETND